MVRKQLDWVSGISATGSIRHRCKHTGGRYNLLGISKRGNKNLRRLLVQCAKAYLIHLDSQRGLLGVGGGGLRVCLSGGWRNFSLDVGRIVLCARSYHDLKVILF